MYVEALLSIAFGIIFWGIGIYKKDYIIYFICGLFSIAIGLLISFKILPVHFCLLSIIFCFGIITIRDYIVKASNKSA